MIVSLFVFFNYILGLLKDKLTIKKSYAGKNDCDNEFISEIQKVTFEGEAEHSDSGVVFFPPVYVQRYRAAVNVLEAHRLKGSIKKVVDFGCAELSFFTYIKQIDGVEEYLAVDIDKKGLEDHYTCVNPLTADYLSKRSSPLSVKVLKGSVAEPDIRLKDSNAVVAIELIEHMYPDELNELPYNIFAVIQPEIAIFTTPNVDFNVLFKSLKRFRHSDHKFEWSREQFEDWAHNLAERYPSYDVLINGIGKGPPGTEELGCCSQIAIFVHKNPESKYSYDNFLDIYECIHEVDYPYEPLEVKLKNTLDYEIQNCMCRFFEKDEYVVGERREIPLEDIIKLLSVECSLEKLLEHLKESDKNVEYINEKPTLVLPYYEQDDYSCSSPELDENDEVVTQLVFPPQEEWLFENGNMSVVTRDHDSNMLQENSEDSICREQMSTVEAGSSNKVDLWEPSNNIEKSEHINENISEKSVKLEVVIDFFENSEIKKPDKFISMGAIPKRRENSNEDCCKPSKTSSKGDAQVKPLRKSDTLNESTKSSFSTNVYISDHSSTPIKSLAINGCNLETADAEKTSNFEQPSEISPSQTAKTDASDEKLVRCIQCSQLCLSNKHKCSAEGLQKLKISRDEITPDSNQSKENCDQDCSFVHRCHSLENVNVTNSKSKNFRYSLNIDNDERDCDTSVVDMDLEAGCNGSSFHSLTDTLGSHSKAADSGYPNSVHDMELDLTPEQVDEIITETESSLEDEDSSADERVEHEVPGNVPPVVFLDNVENGDVANNNRDGEGNNMEGGEAVEEELNFEGLVIEGVDAEAGQNESEDEGLYLSALDTSNETLVPEESYSHDDTAFNSVFDLPSSSSSFFRPFDFEVNASVEQDSFPTWLLDISVNDEEQAGGDHNIGEGEDSSESVIEIDGSVEVIVPGDSLGGGEPIQN